MRAHTLTHTHTHTHCAAGMSQPNLLSFEPTYADELKLIFEYAFEYMQVLVRT